MDLWYFAYGSNLLSEQMAARTEPLRTEPLRTEPLRTEPLRTEALRAGDARPRLARLPNYEVAFNMLGEDGQIYANLSQPGQGVLGIVYRCSQAALERLDLHEGGYDRCEVTVTDEQGIALKAITYIARPECVTLAGQPSAEYLEKILSGARAHGLPEPYVLALKQKGQLADPSSQQALNCPSIAVTKNDRC